MSPFKIILCDDHQLILDGLKNILLDQTDLTLIGEANNGQQALKIVEVLQPDLILMDIDMPVMNGLEATQQIRKKYPNVKVMILTMHDEPSLVRKIMEIGANGYMLKNSDQEELIKAIHLVLKGELYFPEEILIGKKPEKEESFSLRPSDAVLVSQLTEREIEILVQIADGLSNKEIGDKLFISHRTVDTHRTNLMKKLDVHNIAGLIRFAIRNNLA
jgi:DNA-binding NarL/FixJ family response regulator